MPKQPIDRASLARDFLANDRTYLAWLRTAANVMILGLVIAKFITDQNASRPEIAGGILVVAGFIILVYGTSRSRRIARDIETGRYATDRNGPILITSLLVVAVLAAILLLYI